MLQALNIEIDLEEGWNMIGFGCSAPYDVTGAILEIDEDIMIIKDNNGFVYLPEYGFNGIGNFIPGYGYQIKVSKSISGYNICDY